MRKLMLISFMLFLLLVGTVSNAAEVTLIWDASIDAPYIRVYRAYKSEAQGEYVTASANPTENNMIWEGAGLTCTVVIPDGQYECYFVVTAVDTRDMESDLSNEVKYDTKPPAAPGNLRGNPNLCMGDFNLDGDVDGTDLARGAKEGGRTDCNPG